MLRIFLDTDLFQYPIGGSVPRSDCDLHLAYPVRELPEADTAVFFTQPYGTIDHTSLVEYIVQHLEFCPKFLLFKGEQPHTIEVFLDGKYVGIQPVSDQNNIYSVYRQLTLQPA